MRKITVVCDDEHHISFERTKSIYTQSQKPQVNFSKKETLDFIDYLRGKENVTIESRIEERRTLFSHYSYDSATEIGKALETIKSGKTAMGAYCALAAKKAKLNSNYRLIPEFGYIFYEDIIEYLMNIGFEEEEAAHLCFVIQSRGFKNSRWKADSRLGTDFAAWAASSMGFLDSREMIFNLFRVDYLEYLHKNTVSDETDFTVTRHTVRGAYNGYAYLTRSMTGKQDDGFIIGYRDTGKNVTAESITALCAFLLKQTDLPEVIARNLDEDEVITVRRVNDMPCKK